jgi:DNA-binding transcriptional MerR regulator
MPNLSDFPDEPRYSIKKISELTGIRPVTLRAWERRYTVLTPHRSDNRYRKYSERDLQILRWLKNQVDNGFTISSVAEELHKMAETGDWVDAIPTSPTNQLGKPIKPPQVYANQLYRALIKHDENRASDLLKEVFAGYDLRTVFASVLAPCLVEIGEAWYRGALTITTEHFASAFLRGKLLTLLQAYPSRRNAPLILVGGAPTEQHEIGALMLAVLLRSVGYRVEFLGPDLPLQDLAEYARHEKPGMIILSAVTEPAALELRPMQSLLNKLRPMPIFAYGGRAFDLHPKLRDEVEGTFLGENLDTTTENIADLFASRN